MKCIVNFRIKLVMSYITRTGLLLPGFARKCKLPLIIIPSTLVSSRHNCGVVCKTDTTRSTHGTSILSMYCIGDSTEMYVRVW